MISPNEIDITEDIELDNTKKIREIIGENSKIKGRILHLIKSKEMAEILYPIATNILKCALEEKFFYGYNSELVYKRARDLLQDCKKYKNMSKALAITIYSLLLQERFEVLWSLYMLSNKNIFNIIFDNYSVYNEDPNDLEHSIIILSKLPRLSLIYIILNRHISKYQNVLSAVLYDNPETFNFKTYMNRITTRSNIIQMIMQLDSINLYNKYIHKKFDHLVQNTWIIGDNISMIYPEYNNNNINIDKMDILHFDISTYNNTLQNMNNNKLGDTNNNILKDINTNKLDDANNNTLDDANNNLLNKPCNIDNKVNNIIYMYMLIGFIKSIYEFSQQLYINTNDYVIETSINYINAVISIPHYILYNIAKLINYVMYNIGLCVYSIIFMMTYSIVLSYKHIKNISYDRQYINIIIMLIHISILEQHSFSCICDI